jgi:hypothetical protein
MGLNELLMRLAWSNESELMCGVHWGANYASDIDGAGFRRRSKSRLLPKCCCGSGRCRSRETGCNRYFNCARGAILCASHPARRRQVLPGVRHRTARLPALLSLVVVTLPPSEYIGKLPELRFGANKEPWRSFAGDSESKWQTGRLGVPRSARSSA